MWSIAKCIDLIHECDYNWSRVPCDGTPVLWKWNPTRIRNAADCSFRPFISTQTARIESKSYKWYLNLYLLSSIDWLRSESIAESSAPLFKVPSYALATDMAKPWDWSAYYKHYKTISVQLRFPKMIWILSFFYQNMNISYVYIINCLNLFQNYSIEEF